MATLCKKHGKKITYLGNFISGAFCKVDKPDGEIVRKSPADFEDSFGAISWSLAHVDTAVEAATRAFKSWKGLAQGERNSYLTNFKAELVKNKTALSEILAREVGKPLWEAATEIDAMVAKVDISIKDGLKEIESREIADIQPGVFGMNRYKPLGVVAVLGPFNFPAHLPNGHWVPALLAGNTVVYKPSEQAPLTAQLIAQCFQAAGLPAGVFNVVQGERAIGEKLVGHPDIRGVFFTGSYAVGRAIKLATLDQPEKLLALEMGGKNASIVCDDAYMDLALSEVLTSAYLTTGQRCSATSRILVHKKIAQQFIDRFLKAASRLKIAHPFEQPFMGPLVNQAAFDRYLQSVARAPSEGVEILASAEKAQTSYQGYYVTPSVSRYEYRSPKELRNNRFVNEELFAPHATFIEFDDIDQAVEIANNSDYGLVASIFTRKPETYAKAFDELECGLINWNKSTVGGSSKLPFGGLKKSGNYFPTALFASRYCSHPVASLENRNSAFAVPITPGLNWE